MTKPETSDSLPVQSAGSEVALADLVAIATWVASKEKSTHTRRAFRFEAQRFLAWLIMSKQGYGYSSWLDKATSFDAAVYARFLGVENKPPIPDDVLRMTGLTQQPFKGARLKAASISRAIAALKAMYADMGAMTLEYGLVIGKSPFARFRVAAPGANANPRRKAMTDSESSYVVDALERIKDKGDLDFYHQAKWMWRALEWGAMRCSELAAAVTGQLYLDRDEEGNLDWMLEIIGKGDVRKSIPVCSQFLDGLNEYRTFRKLPPILSEPAKDDFTPLVLPRRGEERNVHPDTIYRTIKSLFVQAASIAIEDGNAASGARLKQFATHTGRHSIVTRIVDETGDLTLAQMMARHGSIVTTQKYKAPSVKRLKGALKSLSTKTQ